LAVSITIGTPESARSTRQTSIPFIPGSIKVEQHQIGADFAHGGQRLRAVADDERLEAFAAQHDREHLG
jgi:hypothetical protein